MFLSKNDGAKGIAKCVISEECWFGEPKEIIGYTDSSSSPKKGICIQREKWLAMNNQFYVTMFLTGDEYTEEVYEHSNATDVCKHAYD